MTPHLLRNRARHKAEDPTLVFPLGYFSRNHKIQNDISEFETFHVSADLEAKNVFILLAGCWDHVHTHT